MKNIKYCKCGCGEIVTSKTAQYINHHCGRSTISKEYIINETKKIFTEHKNLTKSEFKKLIKHCCSDESIRTKFNGLDFLAKKCGVIFKPGNHITITKDNWEQKLGKEKANRMRIETSNRFKNKSWEEHYGKRKAKAMKKSLAEKQSINRKGVSWEKLYGKEKANQLKTLYGQRLKKMPPAKKYSKKYIIDVTKKIFDEYKTLTRADFSKIINEKYFNIATIKNKFGSMSNFTKKANIKFHIPKTTHAHYGKFVGYNEKEILDFMEILFNVNIERQIKIGKYVVDGYDRENNIVYEVDEEYHKNQKIEDKIREKEIKKRINCNFIRINEKIYVTKIKNSATKSFEEVINHGLIQK